MTSKGDKHKLNQGTRRERSLRPWQKGNLEEEVIGPAFSERGTGSQLGWCPAFISGLLEKLQPQHHVKQTYFSLSVPIHSPAVSQPPSSALRLRVREKRRLVPVPDFIWKTFRSFADDGSSRTFSSTITTIIYIYIYIYIYKKKNRNETAV